MKQKDPRLPSEVLFACLSGAEVCLCFQTLFTGQYIVFVSIIFQSILSLWTLCQPNKASFRLCSGVHWVTTGILIISLIYSLIITRTPYGISGWTLAFLSLLITPVQGATAFACSRQSNAYGFHYWAKIKAPIRTMRGAQTEVCGHNTEIHNFNVLGGVTTDLDCDEVIGIPESAVQSAGLSSPKSRDYGATFQDSVVVYDADFRKLFPPPVYQARSSAVTSPGRLRSEVCVVDVNASSPKSDTCHGHHCVENVHVEHGDDYLLRQEILQAVRRPNAFSKTASSEMADDLRSPPETSELTVAASAKV